MIYLPMLQIHVILKLSDEAPSQMEKKMTIETKKALSEMTNKEMIAELESLNCIIPDLKSSKKSTLTAILSIYREQHSPKSNKNALRSSRRTAKTTWQMRIEAMIELLDEDHAIAYNANYRGKGWLFEISEIAELWADIFKTQAEKIEWNSDTEQDSGCFRYAGDWKPSYQTIGRTLIHNGLLGTLRMSKGKAKCITIVAATDADVEQYLKPASDECDFDAIKERVKEQARKLDNNWDSQFLAHLKKSQDVENADQK
tara:strand:+ start:542 stop:1312 length:771 start_codon:yes stop_codon:yes gene_type:complete